MEEEDNQPIIMHSTVDGIGRKPCRLIRGDGLLYMNETNFEHNTKRSCASGTILSKRRTTLGSTETMEKEGFYEERRKSKYMVGYHLVFYYATEGLSSRQQK